VWDSGQRRFVWREVCGNNLPDHQLAGGFEWEGDSRNYLALGEANVRGQRRGGLIMLAFPDGNVLNASWKVSFAKGQTFRIQYALTDDAAAKSSNGLKFTVAATDPAGNRHTIVERVLKPGDQRIYAEEVRFDYAVQQITFTHDNLGSEMWDVLWIHPEGLGVPRPLRPSQTPIARPAPEPATPETTLPALRRAIEDLCATFPDRYPRGKEFLARLDGLERRAADVPSAQVGKLREEIETLRREALIANPLVSGQPMLYVVRKQYKLGGHHAIDNLFHTGEINTGCFEGGGALKTVDLVTGRVRTLFETREGMVRDPEVHFSGQKIVFALRKNIRDDYHLYEINADGSGLRQLTSAPNVCDFDPLYLPDDSIVFSSTREPKYNQCSRDIAANLFRMEPDGANIHQITRNNLFDNHAALLPDGRILYERWEYVDRNFGDAHGLWTVNPDGTNQSVYWGNNTASPAAVSDPRIIPGTERVLCIFGPHHHRPWGALAIVDRRIALDGREPVIRIWPADAIRLVRAGGPFDCDAFAFIYPKYEDPYPLSARHFLVSRMTLAGPRTWVEADAQFGHQMGIYLVDVFGNEVLLHVEEPACFDPMPLGPRPRPPVIPSRRDFENREGVLYVLDVYQGTHLRGVRRGAVRWLRVVESPEKRHWSPGSWNGQGYTAPGMNWHSLENKRILGIVPVEPDGSAYFIVPSDAFLYFQLLDENGMMIQSMRSGTVLQSGERTGCVGCHENRLTAAPAAAGVPLALRRPPSRLQPWHGEPPRAFGYMAEVQPVLDKHCVSCHDYGKPAAKKLNLAADRDITFSTSYNELWRKGYIHCVGAGPAETQPAYSWGSHASKLIGVLRKGHKDHNDLKLSPDELDRLITWVDLNGVYYPSYASAYPDHLTGRCPLDGKQVQRLSQLVGVNIPDTCSYGSNRGPLVSFDRPEVSPCLSVLKDKDDSKYQEALALIQAGKDMLAKCPREDMPGSVPCEVDRRREAKYAMRRQIELRNRAAIRAGQKVYDNAE